MVTNYALSNAGGMGPAKRKAQEGICVAWCANLDAANVCRWEADAPKAIGQVNGGDAR